MNKRQAGGSIYDANATKTNTYRLNLSAVKSMKYNNLPNLTHVFSNHQHFVSFFFTDDDTALWW
jgi:hypothetical protein